MGNELQRITKELAPRGGSFAKEFKRYRSDEHLQWNIEKAYALEIISQSNALQKCSGESIARSLIDLGAMGLTLSPAMKLAYLIPYKNQCTVSPSYMGLEQIAYKTGFVEMIQTVLVHENDPEFNVWTDENGRHISHIEASGNRGKITHAYCIAWFSSGRQHIEVMDITELEACRDAATKKNLGQVPFTYTGAFKGEMFKKNVLRRGWKHWPRVDNPRIREMMNAVDNTDPMDFTEGSKTVAARKEIQDKLIGMMADAGWC
jgi:recombination protein RecT